MSSAKRCGNSVTLYDPQQILCIYNEEDWSKNRTLINSTEDLSEWGGLGITTDRLPSTAEIWFEFRTYEAPHRLHRRSVEDVWVIWCDRLYHAADRSKSAKIATSPSPTAFKTSESTRRMTVSVENPDRWSITRLTIGKDVVGLQMADYLSRDELLE